MTRPYYSETRSAANAKRRRAEANGHLKYVGTPCKHGHAGIRYSKNGLCVECQAGRNIAAVDTPFIRWWRTTGKVKGRKIAQEAWDAAKGDLK